MPSLSETKDLLNRFQILPKKSLGQNFLISKTIVDQMIAANNLTKQNLIVEIGPGLGALTKALAKNAGHVDAYEIDQRMVDILQEILGDYKNLEIYQTDILKFNLLDKYRGQGDLKVIANLPYYITSEIVEKLICELPTCESMTLMMQKEAAARILLQENESKYGVTAILLDLYGQVKQKIQVDASKFFPRPKVNSLVLVIEKAENSVFDIYLKRNPNFKITDFKTFLESSFAMRRKTLINNWKKSNLLKNSEDLETILTKEGLDLSVRPEQVSPEKFWQLYMNMADYMDEKN